MPAPTTYQPPRAAAFDLLLDFHFHQGGPSPHGYVVFGHVNKVAATPEDLYPGAPDPEEPSRILRGNDFGKVWYEERPELGVYTLWLSGDVGGLPALQRIAWFDAGVRARIAAGAALFDALADQCYALLDLARDLNSCAAILAQLGAEVRGNGIPFPA